MVFPVLKNICYFIIGVTSVGSNAILITVLLRFEHLRTTANIFILNLAVCDLTTVLTSIPFAVAIEETSSYPFGYFGCKVLMPAATAAVNSAAFTLLLIAVERFYAVMLPMRARLQSFKTKCIVLCVLHGLSIASVIPFSMHQRYSKAKGRSTCQEVWQNKGDQPYTLFLFSIQYMIPLTLIIILYSISWNAIRKQNHVIIKMQQLQQKGSQHFSRSNSLDVGVLRKSSGRSAVDGADEDMLMKVSPSLNSFKSSQLKAVDETEVDNCSQHQTSSAPFDGESHNTCSFKSSQLQVLREDEQTGDTPSLKKADSTTATAAEVIPIDQNNANGKSTGIASETAEAKCQRESDQFTGKKPWLKRATLGWNFKPFAPQDTQGSAGSFSQHPLEENDPAFLHSAQNGVKHADEKLQSPSSFKNRMSDKQRDANIYRKMPMSPKIDSSCQESRECRLSTEYSEVPALGTNRRNLPSFSSRKFSIQKPSISGNMGIPQCSRSNKQDIPDAFSFAATSRPKFKRRKNKSLSMRLSDDEITTQSKSSTTLQVLAAHSHTRLISPLDKDTHASKCSQLGSTARRRLVSIFCRTSDENRDIVSIKRMKQTRRTLIMFTCVVIVFAICMLPNQITWLWISFRREQLTQMITTIFYFLTYTNSILNPWIYAAVTPSFRKAYRRLFCRRAVLRMKQQSSSKTSFLAMNRFHSVQTLAEVPRRDSPKWRSITQAQK